MAAGSVSTGGGWSSRAAFLMAAVGSAVGLGNIWKFPYEAGQGGGAAFVAVYLIFVFAIGVPVMIGELAIGRRGGLSPIGSTREVAKAEGLSPNWQIIGWLGVVGAIIVLSFYSVIAGWTLKYIVNAATGGLDGITPEAAGALLTSFHARPMELLGWHAVFMALTAFVVYRGVQGGLEKAVTWLMPALFVILLILVGYSVFTADIKSAMAFLFTPDFSKLTPSTLIQALGQAFFSLSLALGSIMMYGAYLPKNVSIQKSAVIIGAADSGVALLAGIAIFPIVFQYGLEVGQGPTLIFATLPIAFGQMPFGAFFGTLFFVLLAVAALTSSISLLEPATAYLEKNKGFARHKSAIAAAVFAFLLGILSVFSLNDLADFKPMFGRTFFDGFDFLTNNIMMPLGGLFTAIFVGWFISRKSMLDELAADSDALWVKLWYIQVRYVCPTAVALVFIFPFLPDSILQAIGLGG